MPSSSNGAGSVELECRSWGICELLYRALLIRQLHCCNRSLALILLSLVLLPLRHQNFLLIWFLIRASLLLFVLLPDVLRQGLTSRPLSTVARPISWTLRRSCQVLQSVEKNVSNELGKQASGRKQLQTGAVCRRTGLLSWIYVLVFTLCSGQQAYHCLPFAGPQGPIGGSLVISHLQAASLTGSHQSWKPRSTLPEQASWTTSLKHECDGRYGRWPRCRSRP